MNTSWEQRLREDLRELADVPGPDGCADRALANARTVRRRRVVLTGAGSMALVMLVAIPMFNGFPAGGLRLPFGAADGGAPCETATDEADPPGRIPKSGQPRFVRVVLDKLPPRNDYTLQSAHGICAQPGFPPNGYAVINLGPYREHGHLTVTLEYRTGPRTCDPQPAPETLFCEDGTDTTPMVLAKSSARTGLVVTAVYPDTRTVSIGAHDTPLDAAGLRSVVTDPEVVELLPSQGGRGGPHRSGDPAAQGGA